VASANRRFEDSSDASIVGDPLRLSDDDISVAVMLGIGGVFTVPIRDADDLGSSIGNALSIWLLHLRVCERTWRRVGDALTPMCCRTPNFDHLSLSYRVPYRTVSSPAQRDPLTCANCADCRIAEQPSHMSAALFGRVVYTDFHRVLRTQKFSRIG
jgi:hypothetical protein